MKAGNKAAIPPGGAGKQGLKSPAGKANYTNATNKKGGGGKSAGLPSRNMYSRGKKD